MAKQVINGIGAFQKFTLKKLSKETVRHPAAWVDITWSDTATENTDISTTTPVNRAGLLNQVLNAFGVQKTWAFCEIDDRYSPKLDSMQAMPDNDKQGFLVGWWGDGLRDWWSSANVSGGDCVFVQRPHLRLEMFPIPVTNYVITGGQGEYPTEFIIQFTDSHSQVVSEHITNNTSMNFTKTINEIKEVKQIDLYIIKWSIPNAFVKIVKVGSNYKQGFIGDDIVSINLLEETEGSIATLPVGNISSNQISLSLQNIDDKYFFGNVASAVAKATRTNRRIEPSIGFNDNLLVKGIYWSNEWDIEDTAQTSALDRLGLLQNVQYNGIGNIDNNSDVAAEQSIWLNKSLYQIATDVLEDLRANYMPDLEYSIEGLQQIIPMGFFTSQSYFDVIKTIASAGCAFAYMDTPTEAEKAQAALRGNYNCMDILRIKPLEQFIYTTVDVATAERITEDDYISLRFTSNLGNIANIITVNYAGYELDEDNKPVEKEDSKKGVTVKSDSSILEFGKVKYEYADNNLIQTASHAQDIATRLRSAFSEFAYMIELQTFGDVTRKIGDILDIPEYNKNNILTRGYYVITKIQTDFDGGLRQSLTLRKVSQKTIIDEMTNSPEVIIVENNTEDRIEERT
jgi:hypothetical protein